MASQPSAHAEQCALCHAAFREVFGLFDVNGGGTIDAQELHSALCSVDINLSQHEIEDVLCVMDEDGIFFCHTCFSIVINVN